VTLRFRQAVTSRRDGAAATRRHSLHTVSATLFGVLILVMALVTTWGASNSPAYAAGGAAVNQCNGTDNVGGEAVACTVTVTNNLDLKTGTTSSTVTVKECHGAANAPPTCTTTTTPSTQLTTAVTQCNGSGNGGGGTVRCSVSIVNNITGNATTSPATVNQCNSAGTGGGTRPTKVCSPIGSTTGATVTQCNSSGNGGGGTRRVRCTVTTSTKTAALPVTINQCVGSGNGGGAVVICSSSVTNHIISVVPSATATPTTPSSPTASPRPTATRTSSPKPVPTKTHTAKPKHPGGGGHGTPPRKRKHPKTPAAGPPGTGSPPNGRLPFTGLDIGPLLGSALLALMLGGMLLVTARRRPIRGRHAMPRRG
jgi:hypothetical protein